jgi:hypothetical protein
MTREQYARFREQMDRLSGDSIADFGKKVVNTAGAFGNGAVTGVLQAAQGAGLLANYGSGLINKGGNAIADNGGYDWFRSVGSNPEEEKENARAIMDSTNRPPFFGDVVNDTREKLEQDHPASSFIGQFMAPLGAANKLYSGTRSLRNARRLVMNTGVDLAPKALFNAARATQLGTAAIPVGTAISVNAVEDALLDKAEKHYNPK